MANPTTVTNQMAVLVAGTSAASVTLDPARQHRVRHLAIDNTGNPDTNTIYFADDADPDADSSEGGNKLLLKSGADADLPLGIQTLKFKTAAGAPIFQVTGLPKRLDPMVTYT